MDKLNVLISLHRGYGMGDAAQMSAVLQHVRKYRTHWHVDYQAEEGKHQVARGLVANHFAYGTPYPTPYYDAEVQICLYDTWPNFHDRPNTRVSTCLRDRFDIEWDAECGRYVVNVSEEARKQAAQMIAQWRHAGVVAVHYEGDSSPGKKNLTHDQAAAICKHISRLGRVPLLLDWRGRSPLPNSWIKTVGTHLFASQWGGNVEMNCALIRQCEAFVGIDSGPSKCASSTSTPALVIWTGHHPAPFHDPAPNTTHCVPCGYHGLYPVCNDAGVIRWFEKHHAVRQYGSDLVDEVANWIKETLR